MSIADFESAKHYVLDRLRRELSPTITYHSIWHTESDVLPAVERLGRMADVKDESFLLLRTAALYHDVGYVIQRKEHELISVQIAYETLPKFGYTHPQMKQIEGIIMATRMPQNPRNFLEQLMADSDLDSIGREDFLKTSFDLRTELSNIGIHVTDKEWYTSQRKFLQGHYYFTNVARQLRNTGKRKNVNQLTELIAQCD